MNFIKTVLYDSKVFWKTFLILITPIACSPILIFFDSPEARCGYTITLMGIYWIFEVLPLPVTGFIPMILFPCLGTMEASSTAKLYFQDTTMIFFGGLMIALAIERVNLHKRIGNGILLLVGSTPSRILIGFLLPTSFLSMWINNTATASMMLPATEAVISQYKSGFETDKKEDIQAFTVEGHMTQEDGRKEMKENHDVEHGEIKVEENEVKKSYDNKGYENAGSNIHIETIVVEVNDGDKPNDIKTTTTTAAAATNKENEQKIKNFSKMLSLAVAFGSLVGGTATLTGSTTNLLVNEEVGKAFDQLGMKSPITYASWLFFGLPHAVICLLVLWGWLQIYFLGWRSLNPFSKSEDEKSIEQHKRMKAIIKTEYDKLGPMNLGEILMVLLMVVLVILWILRDPGFIPGYATLFKEGYVTDSFPPMLISILLFALPMERPDFIFWRKKDERAKRVPSLLDWETVSTKLPWGPLMIIGSGFVLAEGCKVSGLSDLIAEQLNGLERLPPWLTSVIITVIVSMITEIVANVTVMALFSPILIAMANNFNLNPLYFIFPSGIASSYAYMLPVAAPSNAIVFSYGHLAVKDMVKAGFVLKMVSLVILTLLINTLGVAVFNLNEVPTNSTVTSPYNDSHLFNFTTIHPSIHSSISSSFNSSIHVLNKSLL